MVKTNAGLPSSAKENLERKNIKTHHGTFVSVSGTGNYLFLSFKLIYNALNCETSILSSGQSLIIWNQTERVSYGITWKLEEYFLMMVVITMSCYIICLTIKFNLFVDLLICFFLKKLWQFSYYSKFKPKNKSRKNLVNDT